MRALDATQVAGKLVPHARAGISEATLAKLDTQTRYDVVGVVGRAEASATLIGAS